MVFDKAMLPSRSTFNDMRVYMKYKSHKWGSKLFMLCCSTTAYCIRVRAGTTSSTDYKSGPAAVARNLKGIFRSYISCEWRHATGSDGQILHSCPAEHAAPDNNEGRSLLPKRYSFQTCVGNAFSSHAEYRWERGDEQNIVALGVINAYIVYNAARAKTNLPKLSHVKFVKQLHLELVQLREADWDNLLTNKYLQATHSKPFRPDLRRQDAHQPLQNDERRRDNNNQGRKRRTSIQDTYPFQVISMEHIPSLPKSFKGNTEVLIWADLFTGYVIAKASPSREAQTVAENYEECVFRRFGASEVIRHDREPGFMSDFFRAFNRIMKMGQSATITYRQQGNGKAERTVQSLTRAVKLYVTDVQSARLGRLFKAAGLCAVYGARSSEGRNVILPRLRTDGTRGRHLKRLFRWDRHATAIVMRDMEEQCRRAREAVNENLRDAIKSRADHNNKTKTSDHTGLRKTHKCDFSWTA
ncbi:reverse transcriptase [Phytophthora megakarya]|uniref:Reverse transcriptase n=1 Tax=Phytophthora megakarya TaxID=4795 RepID=A0A225WN12_9STRA|nr:reverse transcriptase [Phytophthora megakarya]